MDFMGWIKQHPIETGGIVFVGGAVVLFILRGLGGGSSQQSSDPNGIAAYYSAQAAQAQSGNALQAVQVQAQAATTQTLLNDQTSIINNTTWSSAQQAENQSNNDTQVAVAPYAVQSSLINALGQVASQPGSTSTTTSSSSDSGFLGIGASKSSSTNTTYTPNPAAVNAGMELGNVFSSLNNTQLYAAH